MPIRPLKVALGDLGDQWIMLDHGMSLKKSLPHRGLLYRPLSNGQVLSSWKSWKSLAAMSEISWALPHELHEMPPWQWSSLPGGSMEFHSESTEMLNKRWRNTRKLSNEYNITLYPYDVHIMSISNPCSVHILSRLSYIILNYYIYNYLQTESGGDNVFRKGTNVGQKAIAGSMTFIKSNKWFETGSPPRDLEKIEAKKHEGQLSGKI